MKAKKGLATDLEQLLNDLADTVNLAASDLSSDAAAAWLCKPRNMRFGARVLKRVKTDVTAVLVARDLHKRVNSSRSSSSSSSMTNSTNFTTTTTTSKDRSAQTATAKLFLGSCPLPLPTHKQSGKGMSLSLISAAAGWLQLSSGGPGTCTWTCLSNPFRRM